MPLKKFDLAGKRIFVAGHRGMVGSALVRRLSKMDCEVISAGRDRLDLLDGAATLGFLAETKPHVVIVAAGKGRRYHRQ